MGWLFFIVQNVFVSLCYGSGEGPGKNGPLYEDTVYVEI